MGKILEVLVLEYDFGRTRTRTRTRASIISKDQIVYGRLSAPEIF
jgi:hypothetical protein